MKSTMSGLSAASPDRIEWKYTSGAVAPVSNDTVYPFGKDSLGSPHVVPLQPSFDVPALANVSVPSNFAIVRICP